MTLDTTVKYSQQVSNDVRLHSTNTALASDSCHIRLVNDDKFGPMSPRIWLPCKSRIFVFCTISLFLFGLSFYTGLVTPKSQCSDNDFAEYIIPTKHSLIRDRLRFPRTRRRLPQCIIIGARKCGTRALLEFLNIHPKIQKAAVEMHFFDDDDKYDHGLDWYRRHMPFSFQDQITVEKSPAYFITERVPGRIRAMNESIRLLLLVREPVTRVISDYTQLYSNKLRKGVYIFF